ncbi:UDP-glucuronic acid decarboxylase 1-like [Zophobas morio]|uniref:UDP-glucuronic acid decarboxylase 1-like n=1 Tax=Zophobas morio TaxID=2755281 RepID=UPI003082F550
MLMVLLWRAHYHKEDFLLKKCRKDLVTTGDFEKVKQKLEEMNTWLNRAFKETSFINVNKVFEPVKKRDISSRKRILITGGAGFVGSHLVDVLMKDGHEIYVMDNFYTGRRCNIEHWIGHPNFALLHHDVTEPYLLEVDQIYHLACPASPTHYQYNPIKTIKTNTLGTMNMLGLARRIKATMLLASSSEVYGDPVQHPQKETYWGNVNPIGPRACYDEGKRISETLCYSYYSQENVSIRVARIFNSFGPRMHPNDGRVVSNFIAQAIKGEHLTIYGDGKQTRSFQYVKDLVRGLIALMNSNYSLPVNLGNPDEYTIVQLASYIIDITRSNSSIQFLPKVKDDPQRRRPDITVAKTYLNWKPEWEVKKGLQETINTNF